MSEKMFTGIIEAIKGLVLKKNSDGSASFAKEGEHISKGDELVLLSGSAEFASLTNVPVNLLQNVPLQVDEINPILKPEPKLSLYENLIRFYMELGLDPSTFIESLEETAAGFNEVFGEGGSYYVLSPLYTKGTISSGFFNIQ